MNEKIRADIDVHWEQLRYDDAIAGGALAFFGDKYPENVRVVGVCDPHGHDHENRCFSKELCGGTHCHRTGEVGAFIIASETSVGSGLRRIEALTGPLADAYVLDQQTSLRRLAAKLSTQPSEIEMRIEAMQAELETASEACAAARARGRA